jgi:uncharacterized protein YgbK (DUF1537 family)
MARPELAIVCDDLSSATDCGVQVARWDLAVTVPLLAPDAWPRLPAAEVISVTTETRPASGVAAYEQTFGAARQLWAMGYRHFFKSMDSTLRGNVLDEVRALVAVADPEVVVVAPAFPTYGRTTVAGIHLLHGRPIHTTEFGSDPRNPVADSDLPRLFAPLCEKQALLGLADTRVPEADLARTLAGLVGGGCRVLIFDVGQEDDLARLVRAVARARLKPLWVGSTGLAGHVGAYLRPAPRQAAIDLPQRPAPGLVIAGTASEHTRRQFEWLEQRSDSTVIKADPGEFVLGQAAARREHDRCRELALTALRQGQSAAIGVLSSRDEVAEVTRLGAQHLLSPAEVAQRITAALARLARDLVDSVPALSGLVATGGDTASAICAEFEAQAIQIVREVEPGIPLTRLLGPRAVHVVIKAGAFGSAHVLLAALQHLTLTTAS